MSRKKRTGETLRLGILFFILVGILVLMSLSFKLATVVKNSNFDGENRFTLLVSKKDPKIISFSPKDKTVFILTLKEPQDGNLGRLFAIPVDSSVSLPDSEFEKPDLTSDIFSLFLNLRDKDTNLTSIDVLRLFLFARSVNQDSISEEALDSYSLTDIQAVTLNNFIDPKITEEKLQIEVVNASETPGLANRLANYITNMGGNVILISTADEILENSEIRYFGNRTYTVSKLKRLLGFKDVKEDKKNSISDVIITIGQDRIGKLPF